MLRRVVAKPRQKVDEVCRKRVLYVEHSGGGMPYAQALRTRISYHENVIMLGTEACRQKQTPLWHNGTLPESDLLLLTADG